MQAFAALSMLIALIITLAMGVRLLLVARRTRGLPELLFGISFLTGGLGQAFGQIGHRLIWNTPGPFATTMNTVLFGLVVVATTSLYAAIWRVFLADSTRGKVVFALGSGLAILGFAMRIHSGDFATMKVDSDGNLLFTVTRVALFIWGALEAFHQSSMLTKRAKLGLADAVAANQIWLWGIAAVFSIGLTTVIGHSTIVLHRSPLEDPFGTALVMLCVFGSAGAMWCAFFPPKRLRRHFESLAPSS